jgi:hypothetical protein
MLNLNDRFEDILIKIIDISTRKDLLEIEYDLDGGIWIEGIYLDDHQESDNYSFTWKIGKKVYEQSEETQSILKLLLCQ